MGEAKVGRTIDGERFAMIRSSAAKNAFLKFILHSAKDRTTASRLCSCTVRLRVLILKLILSDAFSRRISLILFSSNIREVRTSSRSASALCACKGVMTK